MEDLNITFDNIKTRSRYLMKFVSINLEDKVASYVANSCRPCEMIKSPFLVQISETLKLLVLMTN